MTILVIGATGKTGRPVVEALRARGMKVKAASRSGEVRFDWADRETWAPALEGAEGAYIVGPYGEQDGAVLVGELLASAPELRRVVLLSVLGADLLPGVVPMAAWERDVRASGKEWTILRPNWFQQNFGEGFAPALCDESTLALPAGDAPVSFVDTRDIGEVAAAALTEDGHHGQTYVLTGPEALDHHQALAILGPGLRYVALTEEEFAGGLRRAGADDRVITWQLGLFSTIRDGENALVTDTVERVTGHPARPLSAYADNLPVYG
ncbi:NAD(P)H-binding protein [Nonomuraea sp. NPDC050556]|uniref:NAD(P)H-binding protein n=1 Tax=Nonomuraea sp. NPDC050556 TaxID=3364369 RepID=UPI0037978DA4